MVGWQWGAMVLLCGGSEGGTMGGGDNGGAEAAVIQC